MAKFNGLFGKMRGKYGGGVFAVIKGQNILREYNGEPANPRSYAQQAQRALLANMTKFYKRATSNFYKFAFEDKTSRESDYNAFARNNIKRGAYLTKEQYDAAGWPAIGRYIMTKGSLPVKLECGWVGDFFGIKADEDVLTNIGTLSSFLLTTYPGIEAGDIITFVRAWSSLDLDLGMPGENPEWEIAQFYVDPTSTQTLASVGLQASEIMGTGGVKVLGFNIDGTTSISMGAVCVSRVTPNGLKVSDSELVLSPVGQSAMDWLASAYQQRQAAASWGGNPEAVLAGGQLPYLPEINTITIATSAAAPWQRRDLAWASGQGIPMIIAGNNLKTSAQGAKIVFKFYGADQAMDNALELLSPTKETSLTATGSATQLTITIPNSVYSFEGPDSTYNVAQGFYALEYNGVVIAFGASVASV